jgi:hypothetical protein
VSAPAFVRAPAGLHAIAVRELSLPRYRWAPEASPALPWWTRITQWIGDRWNEIVQAVFGRVHGGSATAVAGDVLLALAVLLVIVFGARLLLTMTLERKRDTGSEALSGAVLSSEWYRRAQHSAAQGDFTTASRCMLGAAVALLRERDAIDPAAGATIGELRRELQARAPQYVSPFATIARIFAIGTYAERPLGRDEFDGAAGAFRTLAGDA